MKINEVIRKYRKEKNLTQEQIANFLGVTAPAVNKWENGISYPDITLLAPLARVLDINLDTLLSFREELTDKEMDQLVKDISESAQNEGYEQGFDKGEKLIKEYPNCDRLILSVAQILNAYLTIKNVENREPYEAKIIAWYELTAESRQDGIASQAAAALVTYYMSKKEYEKAQQLLDKIPSLGYDKRITQAILFSNQGKKEQAFEIYEQMLYKASNEITGVLQIIVHLLCEDNKWEEAEHYSAIGKTVAELFDLGTYTACVAQLFLELKKEDKEKSIDLLEQMTGGLETMGRYQKSALYTHMKFNEAVDFGNLRKMILKGLEKDKMVDFIRNEPRFKKLLKQLKE